MKDTKKQHLPQKICPVCGRPFSSLILTLRLDDQSQNWFNAQRQKYFPPERNILQAHCTLFHHLPDNETTHTILTNIHQKIFAIDITGLINLGAGVAYKIDSQPLQLLHKYLSKQFTEALISQDRQPFRPHITISNKTTPEKARALIAHLQKTFQPISATARGLDCWTYLGGPWRHERTVDFEDLHPA